jgi:hypothetical protein
LKGNKVKDNIKLKNILKVKLISPEGTRMELEMPKGTSIDSIIESLEIFSDQRRWNDREKSEDLINEIKEGQMVLVDSSYGIVPAYVNNYPSRTLFQDVASNNDEGMKNSKDIEFTVKRWKYIS